MLTALFLFMERAAAIMRSYWQDAHAMRDLLLEKGMGDRLRFVANPEGTHHESAWRERLLGRWSFCWGERMKQAWASAFVLFAAGLLAGCVPSVKRPTQRFVATTSLQENRVVTVKNLGPLSLWLGQNACAQDGGFKVGGLEPLPFSSLLDCEDFGLLPRSWPVGQSFTARLPYARLPSGTYTLKLWADLELASYSAARPTQFQTVRVFAAPTTVNTP